VDAGINGTVARHLPDAAATLTTKPLRYLVNTNYHGDHTFGNAAFPDAVEIVAHRLTAAHQIGPGNTPGDTAVYLPNERIAWTGNFVSSERVLPMLLEVPPLEYIDSLARAKAALDIERLVPGHGPMAKPITFTRTMRYLWALHRDVKAAFRRRHER
jgi:cyclase